MLHRLLGAGSTVDQLKGSLDASQRAVRGIAHRVANAANGGEPLQDADFGRELDRRTGAVEGAGEEGPVDVEREMVALAEEQLRQEATARLLQKTYEQIRLGLRDV